MQQPEAQLRQYFEAGVERITVEDVLLRAATVLDPPRRPSRTRPLLAAASAFFGTIVAVGGVVALLNLIDQAGTVGSGGISLLAPPAAGLGWPFFLIGAGGVAALTTYLFRHHTHHRKVDTMDTMERTTTEREPTLGRSRTRRLTITIFVLVAALLAVTAYALFWTRPLSPYAAPDEIVTLMEDYVAAWNDYDPDALATLVTDDYRVHSTDRTRNFIDEGFDGLTASLPFLVNMNWSVTADNPFYAVKGGEALWFVSTEASLIETNRGQVETIDVWLIREIDGRLLIEEHFILQP